MSCITKMSAARSIINKVVPTSYSKDSDGSLVFHIYGRFPAPDTIAYHSNKIEQENKKNRIRLRLQKKLNNSK